VGEWPPTLCTSCTGPCPVWSRRSPCSSCRWSATAASGTKPAATASTEKKGKAAKPAPKPASGIAVGLNKGHIVVKRVKRERPSQRKGRLGDRVKLVRGVVREVVGWAPYEKRIMEILKGGGNNPNKRAWRFAKLRLGTHSRAKRKVSEMTTVNAALAQRAAAQAKAEGLKVEEKKKQATKKDPNAVSKDKKKRDAKKAAASKAAEGKKSDKAAAKPAADAAPAKADDKPAAKADAKPAADKKADDKKADKPKADKKDDKKAAPKDDKKKK